MFTKPRLAEFRKGLAAAAGFSASLIALDVLHGTPLVVAECVIAVAGTYGVVAVPNKPPKVPSGL